MRGATIARATAAGVVVGLSIALGAGCGGGGGEEAIERDRAAGPGGGGPRLAKRLIGNFLSPVYVTQPPGVRDLLFVVEKRGVVRVVRGDKPLERPFLDLRRRVRDAGVEQGMAAIAFPPGYRRSGRFYVSYTDTTGGDLRIEEFRRSRKQRTVARRDSRRPVLVINQPEEIHNGGLILFGPDGRLYVGAGDGGPSYDPDDRGQDKDTLLGKLLRIEPRRKGAGKPYGIPRGNPFRGRGRAEIYAYGLRNPWRFSFDPKTDALLLGDVGQDDVEEINFVNPGRARGANFGWSGFEGTRPFKPSQQAANAIPPFHEYLHEGRCSVTGGVVVRTPTLPSLRGRYLYGDFCDGEIRSLLPPTEQTGDGRDDRKEGLKVPALVSFGTDDRRRVYVVSLEGPVSRLVER